MEDAEDLVASGVPVGQTCIIHTNDGAGLAHTNTEHQMSMFGYVARLFSDDLIHIIIFRIHPPEWRRRTPSHVVESR